MFLPEHKCISGAAIHPTLREQKSGPRKELGTDDNRKC